MVEDKVKSALGVKDEEKGAKKGGIISKVFHKDEKKKEKPPAEKESFFSKIFDHDGDKKKDKPVEKKSGFAGLFSEREDAGDAVGYDEGAAGGIGGIGEGGGQSDTFNDEELLNDLMDVASNGN
ncbi:hypothetical protein EPR50_G00182600 [Perca flavescens]|uniref:Myelin basic protein n=1 Tax=Perca flavescens TaxID=8167 RepID=A0A484CI55_PERFV|nr:hypothetical protein EPR50_G00182600 [Perca flavescens]